VFQHINATQSLSIFVKEYMIRCDKVCNACYPMPVSANRNDTIRPII